MEVRGSNVDVVPTALPDHGDREPMARSARRQLASVTARVLRLLVLVSPCIVVGSWLCSRPGQAYFELCPFAGHRLGLFIGRHEVSVVFTEASLVRSARLPQTDTSLSSFVSIEGSGFQCSFVRYGDFPGVDAAAGGRMWMLPAQTHAAGLGFEFGKFEGSGRAYGLPGAPLAEVREWSVSGEYFSVFVLSACASAPLVARRPYLRHRSRGFAVSQGRHQR